MKYKFLLPVHQYQYSYWSQLVCVLSGCSQVSQGGWLIWSPLWGNTWPFWVVVQQDRTGQVSTFSLCSWVFHSSNSFIFFSWSLLSFSERGWGRKVRFILSKLLLLKAALVLFHSLIEVVVAELCQFSLKLFLHLFKNFRIISTMKRQQ